MDIVSNVFFFFSSPIEPQDLKEKREAVEDAENGRDAPNGNAENEENGEQEAENEVEDDDEEDVGDDEEDDDGEILDCCEMFFYNNSYGFCWLFPTLFWVLRHTF
uniref:Uncharacterized protein n=1 Tax=Erpetoichthys calabaricus TaxID=27687 RepID=A0A8C4S5T6_ERPCA